MTAPTTPNAELAYRVLDHIDAHPEQHEQSVWIVRNSCGTAACLAGWACLLSGDRPDLEDEEEGRSAWVWSEGDLARVSERAAQLLGIPYDDNENGYGHPLFDAENTREDLGRLVAEIFGPRPERDS